MRGSGKNGKQASFVATATWIYGSLHCPVYGYGFVRLRRRRRQQRRRRRRRQRDRSSLPTTLAYPFVAFSPLVTSLFRVLGRTAVCKPPRTSFPQFFARFVVFRFSTSAAGFPAGEETRRHYYFRQKALCIFLLLLFLPALRRHFT